MSDSIKQEIEEIFRRFEDLYKNDKFEEAAQLYTEDARYMVPGAETAIGRTEIAKAAEAYKIKMCAAVTDDTKMKVAVDEVGSLGGDLIYSRGRYSFTDKGVSVEAGKYVGLYKRVDGKLRIYTDIWNASA